MENKIKLGVSLYSFSTEYISEQLDLEGLLKKVKELGFEGIEMIPAQMAPEYPYLSDEWIEEFKGLLAKYELTPVCWSAYIDMGIRSDRDLTEEEIIQYTLNDLIYAKKAGFPMVRTQHAISPKIFRAMIPYCKQLGVKLTIEMHHPHHPDVPVWKEFFEIMKGEGKGVLGFVPDFSIFQTRPHQLYIDQSISYGCRVDKLNEIIEKHDQKVPLEEVLKDELLEIEKHVAEEIYHKFSAPAKMEQWKDIIDCVFYIHGKFYYLADGEHDPCIPYEELLTTIKDLGYNGYIASEYEGHHFDETIDSAVQLQRYVALNKKILGY
ncbi:MAG: sugar phosphate isomerase/epimerase [Clostridiales bacterium]|jgi:sugar phosphate isomerase/epimerase|nr:sugar phosphate isomerase/epimerase [Clostridiales bacterium]